MPEYNNIAEEKAAGIVSLLRKHYNVLKKKRIISVFSLFGGIMIGGFCLLILAESGFYLSWWVKTVSLVLLLFASAGSAVLLYRNLRRNSFKRFYEQFFTVYHHPELLNAVDLYLDPSQKKSLFYNSALQKNINSAKLERFPSDLKDHTGNSTFHTALRNALILLFITGFSVTVISLIKPAETLRTASFWTTFTQPNPFTYSVVPGDTTIEHGTVFRSSVQFDNDNYPDEIILAYKTDVEENFRYRNMSPAENRTFTSPELELTNSITYYLEMDGFKSRMYQADVRLQPRFDELAAEITPPSYTGLQPTRTEYPFSEIQFYRGSEIMINGRANKPLSTIQVRQNGELSDMNPVEDSNKKFKYSFNPDHTDTLSFRMEDEDGLRNRNPFRTQINLREDEYPVVVIHDPPSSVMISEPGDLAIYYQATDDFDLTRAELRWQLERAFAEEPLTGSHRLDRPVNGRTERTNWDLRELELRPRDQLTFRIRVWDNDEVSGYKWSESQTVTVQIPSLAEFFEELDSKEREVQTDLDQISDNFRDMEREYEEFIERLRQNPEGGFEEEQILEEIQERQQSIDDAVKQMNERFQEIRSEMMQSDRISEETRRAYEELQQLMNDLDDPALQQALEELRNALQNMSPQEMERALEEVDFNENLYRERLERTAELFKRLKMNSDLDKLASQYQDMSERLQGDSESTLEQLTEEMQNVREDMDSTSDQLEQLDSNPPRRSEETLKNLKEEATKELNRLKQELDQLQQDAGDQLQDGQTSPDEDLQQQQQQISQQLQQEAEKFRSSVQQMSGQQIQVNMLALQQALYTLLELSETQEFLARSAAETRSQSQGFVELARLQNNVSDQFTIVADTLFRVSSELPGVPNQINRKKAEVERTLARSMDQMVERNQRNSSITTRESLGGINDLTSMLASLIDQLMDQQGNGGGGGMNMQQMVEQLQNMSQDQQMLNQQLQDLINDAQGDRLTREESERLDQLARQQNEIRRQLQKLQQSGALEQGDRTLSELQRMMEEMEDSINDMRGGITDPLMVQRQQNILSRMLDAEESLQQRGESEEREGTDITGYDRTLPPDMTLEELQQEIRSRMQDPNYSRFSEQYQRLIERYFEQLRRLENSRVP